MNKKITVTDVRVLVGDSAFLIDDGTTSVLIDSGFGFTGDAVTERIRALLGTRSLDYIFLTHSHYDHVLGAAYVLHAYPNACVVAGDYAAKIFAKDSAKAIMRYPPPWRRIFSSAGTADPHGSPLRPIPPARNRIPPAYPG